MAAAEVAQKGGMVGEGMKTNYRHCDVILIVPDVICVVKVISVLFVQVGEGIFLWDNRKGW